METKVIDKCTRKGQTLVLSLPKRFVLSTCNFHIFSLEFSPWICALLRSRRRACACYISLFSHVRACICHIMKLLLSPTLNPETQRPFGEELKLLSMGKNTCSHGIISDDGRTCCSLSCGSCKKNENECQISLPFFIEY